MLAAAAAVVAFLLQVIAGAAAGVQIVGFEGVRKMWGFGRHTDLLEEDIVAVVFQHLHSAEGCMWIVVVVAAVDVGPVGTHQSWLELGSLSANAGSQVLRYYLVAS
jgi:hypothetical protein